MNQNQSSNDNKQTQLVGWLLASIGILTLVTMLLHPEITTHGTAQQIAEINQKSAQFSLVHGIMIGFIMLFCVCLSCYSVYRNIRKVSIIAALVFYLFGSILMVVAALINGFVITDLAQSFADVPVNQLNVFRALQKLTWYVNQAMADFASIAWMLAALFWSIDLLIDAKGLKTTGVLTLILSASTIIALVFGWLQLDIVGMTLLAAVHSVVSVTFAYQMIRA